MTAPRWIAAAWGPSSLRIWAMAGRKVLTEGASDQGVSRLGPRDFESALLTLASGMLPPDEVTPVLICGQAGARKGWVEVPHEMVPCAPHAAPPMPAPSLDSRISVGILPGLGQIDPPDVMRGEETRIAGFLLDRASFDGVLCMPGLHGKWVRLRHGIVQGFRTMMTGEIYGLIARQSVLRHMMDDSWDEAAFRNAVDESTRHPETIVSSIFGIRASALLSNPTPGLARARLSGLMVGCDIGAMRTWWHNRPVAVLGTERVSELYASALASQGADVEALAGDRLTLAGLIAAHERTGRLEPSEAAHT
ncbi:hypothetical protein BYZ73_00055 [Rhodovulum viride]|uniref:2-dehydro-3-deoxygalactonokinase n=1 Tax=Rhodovulum viride TaxID=1231134 RepID=A0ABX9DNP2_9RHOB|nr:2-dehydro-3-deoxygalactonokinase [Rhodovulum viride]RAP43145.1 hypothetical protein BYZ73_00055 [Rhodovulum viride]